MSDNSKTLPGPVPFRAAAGTEQPHRGVLVTGDQGDEGRKAFYIHIEALPGREDQVMQMLNAFSPALSRNPQPDPGLDCAIRRPPSAYLKPFPIWQVGKRMWKVVEATSSGMWNG